MNIFYLDENPVTCAQYHCDQHVVKMCTEYSQILSTAHHVMATELAPSLCKKTHENHPSNLWIREGRANYKWLHSLLVALCREYTYRYGRTFLYEANGRVSLLKNIPRQIPAGHTELKLAVPQHYSHLSPIEAYRAFYANEKYDRGLLKYSGRELPTFLKPFGIVPEYFEKR
jgi:hypothetical protein